MVGLVTPWISLPNPSEIWNEDDKKEFVSFVTVLMKLKIFQLHIHGSKTKLTGVSVDSVTGNLIARWETKK